MIRADRGGGEPSIPFAAGGRRDDEARETGRRVPADVTALERCKACLAAIVPVIGHLRPILYLDYPVHENIGDLMINAGTEQFFAEHGLRVWRRHSIFDYPRGSYRALPEGTVIVLHGGGNFGDLWLDHQEFRERVVGEFPRHRIVVMPQTVHFRDPVRAGRAFAALARHADLHVFARDRVSLSALREGGLRNVAAAPDMAHALWPALRSPPEAPPSGTLHLFRADIEAGIIPAAISQAREAALDWGDSMPRAHVAAFRAMRKLHLLAARTSGWPQLSRFWYPVRDRLIDDGIAMFAGRGEIVTDRLHGVLLAALLRIPVLAVDNSYGKLSSYIDAWLPDLPGLRLFRVPAPGEIAAKH